MHLLPRDEKFFDLLVDHGDIVMEASRILAAGMRNDTGSGATAPDPADTARRIRILERKGDESLRAIYRRLNKSFITPIDAEDVHQLATSIDGILDHIETAAYQFDAYCLGKSSTRLPEIAAKVQQVVETAIKALETLRRVGVEKPDELTAQCDRIIQSELETENFIRDVIRDLFLSERDPLDLMKKKEICETLQLASNSCRNVADVLETVGVKNS